MEGLREEDLYKPVRDYLEGLGYEVKGEVKGCDITALRDGELIVVELKRGFTLELIYQALDRQRIADGVYVAVPLPKGGYWGRQTKRMEGLCRRLELGLIYVGVSSGGTGQVDVAVHPSAWRGPRREERRRQAVIREHEGRTGSKNTGGVSRKKILTAYKEQALLTARILREKGPMGVSEVKKAGGPANSGAILGRNVLGWFKRERKGENGKYVYGVAAAGLEALEEYRDILTGPQE